MYVSSSHVSDETVILKNKKISVDCIFQMCSAKSGLAYNGTGFL